jgi:hypothetical protein
VPAAFLFFLSVCVAGGVVYRPLLWLAAGTAGLYAAVALFFSAQISTLERDPRLFFLLPAVFGVRHFVHGFGTLFGLVLVAVPGKHWKGRRARKG